MSDETPPARRRPSRGWPGADQRSPSFEEEQHSAAAAPAAFPACLSDDGPLHRPRCSASWCSAPSSATASSFRPFNLSAHPPAGHDHRHRRHRADAGHPDRRHRPLGRRDHGPLVDRHGPHLPSSTACRSSSPSRSGLLAGFACGFVNGADRHAAAAAAVHRDARHLEHLRRAQPLVFAQRDDPAAGHRGSGAVPALTGTASSSAQRALGRAAVPARAGRHLRLDPDDRAVAARLVRPEPHRLRPPRLRDRRRSGRGAPRRHQHRPHAARGLRARRP